MAARWLSVAVAMGNNRAVTLKRNRRGALSVAKPCISSYKGIGRGGGTPCFILC